MANSPTAKKMILVHEKRRQRNQRLRSTVRTALRKTREAIGSEASVEAFQQATSLLDKMVGKGVMHKNKVARTKSRLARKLNAAG